MANRSNAKAANLFGQIALVCLAGSWLVANHYPPWSSFYNESVAAIGVAFWGAAAVAMDRRICWPSSALALLALALVPIAQWASGVVLYRGDAALAAGFLAGTALCIASAATISKHLGSRLTLSLAWTFFVPALASVGIELYQWLGLSGLEIWAFDVPPASRVPANLAQPNQLATLLCWGIVSAEYLVARGALSRTVGNLSAGFLVLGIALTQSRTPYVTAAVAMAVLWLRYRSSRAILQIAAYVLLLVLTTLFFGWFSNQLLLSLQASTRELAVGLRPLLWSQLLFAAMHSPLAGYGWLQIHGAQASTALVIPGIEYSSYAHNILLDLLLWNGPLVGVALCAALCWWCWSRLRAAADVDGWFCTGVVIAFSVHALLEYPHAYAYFLVPVGVVIGHLEWIEGRPGLRSSRTSLVLPLTAVMVVAGAVMHDYLGVEEEGRTVRMEIARIGGVPKPHVAPDVWLLDELEDTVLAARIDPTPEMKPSDYAVLRRTAERFPSLFFLPRLAEAGVLTGRVEDAVLAMKRLRGIHGEEQYAIALRNLAEEGRTRFPALLAFEQHLDRPNMKPASNGFVAASTSHD